MIVDFVDAHKQEHGVEPICTALADTSAQIAPSTYYASHALPASPRAVRDGVLTEEITAVHRDNYGVYGARKVHAELNRPRNVERGGDGSRVARCTVERLMRHAGLRGLRREKAPRTTQPGKATGPTTWWNGCSKPPPRTGCGWPTSPTSAPLRAGCTPRSSSTVFSRMVVGWQVSTSLHTSLAVDALDMGLWARRRAGADVTGLVHHSDKGVQYVAVRYTQRLADAGAVASVGSTGDSYDNALAEAFNSLFKAELVRNKGPWRCIDDLEIAVAEYMDWFNHRRLHGEIGLVPPVEHENNHYRHNPAPTTVAASLQSLH